MAINLTNLKPSHAKRIEEKDVSHKKALVIIDGVTVKMFGFSGILCVQASNFIAQHRMSLEILYFPHIEINTQQDRSTPHTHCVSVCVHLCKIDGFMHHKTQSHAKRSRMKKTSTF